MEKLELYLKKAKDNLKVKIPLVPPLIKGENKKGGFGE
jgi:hypothetical protein